MRELKFRAWDVEFERWVQPYDVTIYGDGAICVDRRDGDGDVIDSVDGSEEYAIIEQYTGLKDSQGREIYEGDIVRSVFSNFCSDSAVEWKDDGYFIKIPALNITGLADIRLNDGNTTIIGNVHENPELVK